MTLTLQLEERFNLELAGMLTGQAVATIIRQALAPVLRGARKKAEAEYGPERVEAAWQNWTRQRRDK